MQEPNEPLQDLDWLSEFIGIPPRTIYNWRLRGEGPPAYRVGRHLRFRRSEVDAWLDGRRDKAQAAALNTPAAKLVNARPDDEA